MTLHLLQKRSMQLWKHLQESCILVKETTVQYIHVRCIDMYYQHCLNAFSKLVLLSASLLNTRLMLSTVGPLLFIIGRRFTVLQKYFNESVTWCISFYFFIRQTHLLMTVSRSVTINNMLQLFTYTKANTFKVILYSYLILKKMNKRIPDS